MSFRGYLFDAETKEVYLYNNRYTSEHSNHCVHIRNKESLKLRYWLRGLMDICNRLDIPMEGNMTEDDLAELVWEKFKEITDGQQRDERAAKRKVGGKNTTTGRGPGNKSTEPRRRKLPKCYRVYREAISEELCPIRGSKLPPQSRAILEGIRNQSSDVLSEQEMRAVVYSLVDNGLLTGKNDAEITHERGWQVFEYYERKHHDYGLVKRGYQREYEYADKKYPAELYVPRKIWVTLSDEEKARVREKQEAAKI